VEDRVLEASVVVIGDEILGGYVTDANSPWLADRLRANGVPLSRVHVVPDEFEAIDEALQAELARSRPRVVFTTGGIGSTPDDITYEAIAASLDRGLVEDPVIAERIDQALHWTQAQGVDVDEAFAWHLKRMARVPEGTRLLLDGAGWTPGLAVDVDGGSDGGGVTIVILPGVPHLLRSIIADVVEPNLLAGRNVPPTVVEVEHGFPESALNLTFVELIDRYPDVKLGSYPGDPMLVRLSGDADEVAGAERLVRGALDELEASPAGERLQQAWTRRLARHEDASEEGA
jgi:molybdenum cofactor synthesis domain-containing protein